MSSFQFALQKGTSVLQCIIQAGDTSRKGFRVIDIIYGITVHIVSPCKGFSSAMVESGQTQLLIGNIQAPDEVQIAREALASLNPSDVGYIATLSILANKLMSRFSQSGNLDDLDEGIAFTKQVLDLAPPSHPHHVLALSNMGQVLVKRFKFRGDASDLTQAIGFFECAVESCASNQPLYTPLVANLCSGLLNRFWSFGDAADLDQIIDKSSYALSTSPPEGPNRDALFNNWATGLKERFQKQGKREDLDTALAHYQSCLDLRPLGHPLRHSALGNFGGALLVRFEVSGQLQDLESAANYYTSALQLLSPGQEGFLLYLTNLGVTCREFYGAQGNVEALEAAINYYQIAMQHSSVPTLDYSRLLSNYGTALHDRYRLLGNSDDLDHAIQYLTRSSEITHATDTVQPLTIFTLAAMLLARFQATSSVVDLDSSIGKFAFALQSCGPGHYQRPSMLSTYGHALSARFNAKGDIQDLDLAASMCKEALALVSPYEANYSTVVGNVSFVLYEYFQHKSRNMEDIQVIIDHCDHALGSTTPVGANFTTSLKIIRAKAFLWKSLDEQEETAISASVDMLREIIATLPEGHAEYLSALFALALALLTRFQLCTNLKDLEEAIALNRIARQRYSPGHTMYVKVCIQLGNTLRERFDFHQDSGGTLDEAVVLLAEAEDLLSATPRHSEYKVALADLGIALAMRSQAQGSRGDLDAAIEYLSRALTFPGSYEDFLVSFALATCLSARCVGHKNLDDLVQSVELFSSAEEQMPRKHRGRGILCRNYGQALVHLSNYRHDTLQYIEIALSFYKEALKNFPPSHYEQLMTLEEISKVEYIRASLRVDEQGFYDAIKLMREVVQTLPEGHPMFYSACHTAASLCMLTWRNLESHPTSLLEDGFRYYEKAAGYTHYHSFRSVSIALDWATAAQEQNHSSALLAYQTCLASLNQHLLSDASVKSRRAALLDKSWVKQTGTLATDATACAITRDELGLAVELSEQGRGLLWSQMAQSSTPLDGLRSSGEAGRVLASEFERASSQLAQSAIAHSDVSLTVSRLTTEEATRRYRELSRELKDIVARIRRQDGFESFFDRASFQSLQRAALGGPVILVNASSQRCDALIVLHDAPPRLVPLPNTTLEGLSALSVELYEMLKITSHAGEEKIRERELGIILRTLWNAVVSPVVDELTGFLPRGARIWWCPTSKLMSLPLHAAGPYRKGALNLANIYVSSYTPTLAALIRARHRPAIQAKPTFVAIGQAKSSSSTAPELQTVDDELKLVRSLVPSSIPFSMLSSDASNGGATLNALNTHAWVHLACHGHPNIEQPFDSSFLLSDRAVTILDIIGSRSEHVDEINVNANTTVPEFAFLSACHTAVGDRDAPDEVIHLAAAMQFAGFRSVIGTMWAVDDGMAKEMVKAFYTHVFSRPTTGGASQDQESGRTEAARALNRASKSVDKGIVALDQRIVFIHIGA